jgi:hypothetical protein
MTVSLGLDRTFCDALNDEISELWQRRPPDLSVSPFVGRPKSFRDYDGPVRERGYRIPDLHSYSSRALDLYLHPSLFRMVELVFDEPALAFQSLYFEYGSMQRLHRDPMFVAADPPLNLCAVWIALEDITDDSGPLLYVPGSHRLPWFEFEPGSIVCKQNVPPGPRMQFARWLDETLEERSLSPQRLTCRRGDAFIWHGGLVHGGAEIDNPARTRKSFVVHYSTAANYKSRTARMQVRRNGEWNLIARTTNRVIERNGARGLDGPLRQRGNAQPVSRSDATRQLAGVARRAKRWLGRHRPGSQRS